MNTLAATAVTAVVLVAAAAMTLAVVGLIRIPDTFVKVHAMSKAVILGPVLVLASTLVTGEWDLLLRALLVGAFLVVTAPVAAHAIVRLERQRRSRRSCRPDRPQRE